MNSDGWVWPDRPKSWWGPRGWNWLHVLAINLPEDPTPAEARAAVERIRLFIRDLPCHECASHAGAYARRFPPDASSSGALQAWAWNFHNAVNSRLKKPTLSFPDYLDLYAEELGWARIMGRAPRPGFSAAPARRAGH